MSRVMPPLAICLTTRSFCVKSIVPSVARANGGTAKTPQRASDVIGLVFIFFGIPPTSLVLFRVISWIAFFGSVTADPQITRTKHEQDAIGHTSFDTSL